MIEKNKKITDLLSNFLGLSLKGEPR